MKPDPHIEQSTERSKQNNMEGGSQNKTQHSESRHRRNRGTMFGGMPRLCRGVQNMLPAYLDESLNAGERQTVARHLDVCAACRCELRLLARSEQALIAAASAVPMPGDLRAGFYARLATTPRRMDRRRVFVPALAVCGLLLASTTAYRLYIMPGGSTAQTRDTLMTAHSIAKAHPVELPISLPQQQIARIDDLPGSPALNRPLHPASALAYQGRKQSSTPATQKTLSAGSAAHPFLASVITGHRAAFTHRQSEWHKERESHQIAVIPHNAFFQRLLSIAAMKTKTNANSLKPRNMQVASLTPGDRTVSTPQMRRDVRLIRGEAATAADSFAVQTEAINTNTVSSAKDLHRGPVFRYESNEQSSRSTTLAAGAERESAAAARDGGAMSYDAEEMDGVSFQVKDARRGFVSGTRSESRMQTRGGRQVLSVHLEDQDRPEPDPADRPASARPDAQPVQTTKTGSEKER